MCSLQYGHPGRDAMLAMVEVNWWPPIHREVIDQARLCEQCLESGSLKQKTNRENTVGERTE